MFNSKRGLTIFAALATMVAFAGCESTPAEPGTAPALVGTVLSVNSSRVLVQLTAPSAATLLVDRAYVNVGNGSDVVVIRRQKGGRHTGSLEEIVPGASIEAWLGPGVLKSLPPQFQGLHIEVVNPN